MIGPSETPAAAGSSSPTADRLEFRDETAPGFVLASFGVLGLGHPRLGFLLSHPDRLFDRGGSWMLLLGLALLLLFGVLPLLFGFGTVVPASHRSAPIGHEDAGS